MNIGMMWLMDKKKPVKECVSEAIEYYKKKYGGAPDAAFANPKTLGGLDVMVDGIPVRPLRVILVSQLWIGVEEAAEGLERASQKLLETAEEATCAWDDVASDDFDGCAGCAGACGFKTQTGQLSMFAESSVLG